MTRAQTSRATRIFFLLAAVPIFLVMPYLRGINNPNEYVRVFTVMSLVEQKTWSIDAEVTAFGWVNDMAKVKKEDGKEHYYMVKTPGVVYAAVPGYWVFTKIAHHFGHHFPDETTPLEERNWWLRASTWVCRFTAVQIPCFLFLIAFERFLRGFSGDLVLRLSAVAAAGLGTNYLAYMHMFASHSQYAVCAFGTFALVVREQNRYPDARRRRAKIAFAAGWLASFCVMLEYHSLFIVLMLAAYGVIVFRRPTRFLAYSIGGLLNVPLVMYFHWRAYGNPLTPGHQLLETAKFAEEHKTGLWGVVWPTWEHVKALSFDPGFGLFGMSPYLAIGFLAIPLVLLWPRERSLPMRRTLRRATFVWILGVTILMAVNAGIIEWRAGWTIGPRYLSAAPPFFAFGALTALESFARRGRVSREIARALGGGLALASVVTIGVVSILFDTLPETIDRPLVQIALPLIRTGFVSHHFGEVFGWGTRAGWFIALACLLAAPAFAALVWTGEKLRYYAVRLVLFAGIFALGMVPAFHPVPGATTIPIPGTVQWFMSMWEPPGRDRLTELRLEAQRYGSRRPCLWYHLADLERAANMMDDAARDERKAGAPREGCRKAYF